MRRPQSVPGGAFVKVSPCQGIAPVEHRVVEYRRWCEGRTLIHKPAKRFITLYFCGEV
jgi:hypothetical protein